MKRSAWTVAADEEPTPVSAHLLRAAALHDALRSLSGSTEIEWRHVDEPEARRMVEVIVTCHPPFQATVPSPQWQLESQLVQTRAESHLAGIVALLCDSLMVQQTALRLGRCDVHLGSGTRVRCQPGRSPVVIVTGQPLRE